MRTWTMMLALASGCDRVQQEVQQRIGGQPSDDGAAEDAAPRPRSATEEIFASFRGESLDRACDDDALSEVPVSANCVSGTLSCGGSVEGHLKGGENHWDDDFYRGKYCTPLPQKYDGPERVYRFDVPAEHLVQVELISPCEDLDLFAMVWSDTSRCPREEHLVSECEADVTSGGGKVTIYTDRNPKTYLVGVDGKHGATGPFKLVARCKGK
ncbi:MAG: hypothetical protein H6739_41215 [Alphaproteobacteria bacterium]|nr:hypothetical protein [Alphaproteobacteria bacterium]